MTSRCFSCWLTLAVAAVVMASGCSETKAPPATVVPASPTPQPGGSEPAPRTPPKATKVVPAESAPTANGSPVAPAPEPAGNAASKANAPRVNGPKKATKAPNKPAAPLADEPL